LSKLKLKERLRPLWARHLKNAREDLSENDKACGQDYAQSEAAMSG